MNMKSSTSCNEIMNLLSICRIGALLLSADGRILAVNDTGARLLLSKSSAGETPGIGIEVHGGNGKPLDSLTGRHLSDRNLPPCVRDLCNDSMTEYFIDTGAGHYVRRHPVPEPSDLPEGASLIGFREADAEARAEMYGTILDKISEGIIACDASERMIYFNDAARKVDSIIPEHVIGKKVREVYTMTDGSDVVLPRVLKQQSPYPNYRQKYTTLDGKHQDVVANAWPIIVRGQLLGAFNVVEDWSKLDDLHKQIIDLQEKLVHVSRQTNQKKSMLTARYTFSDILHHSAAMKQVVEQCRQVARTDSSVMIYGETGTGKELFAQSIHNASSRADGPFLAINCAALPENLLESLLFGSVKGAYTGAENRTGLFEQANHGTLLLDEINSMNIALQAKLLRVLQEGRIRKVGGSEEIPVDVRVLSNINVPPYEAIAANQLRQDLFYRLGVVNINIPPLRERREDIPSMVEFFIEEGNRKFSRAIRQMDQETLQIFLTYHWPGNVRELQHAVEHAMIITPESSDVITKEFIPQHILTDLQSAVSTGMADAYAGTRSFAGVNHTGIADDARNHGGMMNLGSVVRSGSEIVGAGNNMHSNPEMDSELRSSSGTRSANEDPNGRGLDRQMKKMEAEEIVRALQMHNGNISRAAGELGISRQNLQYRLKRHGIDAGKFRTRRK